MTKCLTLGYISGPRVWIPGSNVWLYIEFAPCGQVPDRRLSRPVCIPCLAIRKHFISSSPSQRPCNFPRGICVANEHSNPLELIWKIVALFSHKKFLPRNHLFFFSWGQNLIGMKTQSALLVFLGCLTHVREHTAWYTEPILWHKISCQRQYQDGIWTIHDLCMGVVCVWVVEMLGTPSVCFLRLMFDGGTGSHQEEESICKEWNHESDSWAKGQFIHDIAASSGWLFCPPKSKGLGQSEHRGAPMLFEPFSKAASKRKSDRGRFKWVHKTMLVWKSLQGHSHNRTVVETKLDLIWCPCKSQQRSKIANTPEHTEGRQQSSRMLVWWEQNGAQFCTKAFFTNSHRSRRTQTRKPEAPGPGENLSLFSAKTPEIGVVLFAV